MTAGLGGRGKGVEAATLAFNQRRFADVVAMHEALRHQGDMDPVVAMLSARSLYEIGRGDEFRDHLSDALSVDRERALSSAMETYYARRQRTGDGRRHEDGWIPMLDVVMMSGLLHGHETLADSVADASGRQAKGVIPRSIVQFWDKIDVPREVLACTDSVRSHNPDCAHRLFSEEEGRDVVVDVIGSHGRALFDACPHSAAKSDFFRAAYLQAFGGIYVDADEFAVRPMTEGFDLDVYDLVLSYNRAHPSCVNNWFVAAPPKHPVVEKTLDHVIANLENVRAGAPATNIWVLTGPAAWTFAVIDIALDPLRYLSAPPFAGASFIAESIYRQIFINPPMDYKDSVEGNWRLLESASPAK